MTRLLALSVVSVLVGLGPSPIDRGGDPPTRNHLIAAALMEARARTWLESEHPSEWYLGFLQFAISHKSRVSGACSSRGPASVADGGEAGTGAICERLIQGANELVSEAKARVERLGNRR